MAINTFRLFYEIASMHSMIGEAPQWHKKKAGALMEATLVKTFNFFALNDTRRLDMAQGSMDGYTPLPGTLRTPFVHGNPVKFRYHQVVKRVPKVEVEAVLYPANVQEVDSDDESGGAAASASTTGSAAASAGATAKWLKHADEVLAAGRKGKSAAAEGEAIAEACMAANQNAFAELAARADHDMAIRGAAAMEGVQSATVGTISLRSQMATVTSDLKRLHDAALLSDRQASARHQEQIAEIKVSLTTGASKSVLPFHFVSCELQNLNDNQDHTARVRTAPVHLSHSNTLRVPYLQH